MESKAVTLNVPCGSDENGPPGPTLRIAFRWQRDRFAHQVLSGDATLLSSVEGDDLQQWPESPPFQEAMPHPEPADPQAVLLVGMAGKSHWSASVEGTDDLTARTVFDIACRISECATNLGCTYRLESAASEATCDDGCFRTSSWQVQALPVDGETSCRLQWENGLLQIQPTKVCDAPTTVRWRYCVEML